MSKYADRWWKEGGIKIIREEELIRTLRGESLELKNALKALNARSVKYPDGKLTTGTSNGTIQYFLIKDGKRKYIKSDERALVVQLAQKEYENKLMAVIKNQVHALDKLVQYMEKSPTLYECYSDMTAGKKLLVKPTYISDEEYAKKWKEEIYHTKGIDENMPEIITNNGEKVRSKSEKIIADTLEKNGVPYKYEYPLKLQSGIIIYPDFLILNKRTRKEYYLEHLGMLDNPEYLENAHRRIRKMQKQGLVIGKNLLITTETHKEPLDIKVLNSIINEYFI